MSPERPSAARLSDEIDKLCPACDGSGNVPVGEHFVSREMALDGGDASLEGQSLGVEYEGCHDPGGAHQTAAAVRAEIDALTLLREDALAAMREAQAERDALAVNGKEIADAIASQRDTLAQQNAALLRQLEELQGRGVQALEDQARPARPSGDPSMTELETAIAQALAQRAVKIEHTVGCNEFTGRNEEHLGTACDCDRKERVRVDAARHVTLALHAVLDHLNLANDELVFAGSTLAAAELDGAKAMEAALAALRAP